MCVGSINFLPIQFQVYRFFLFNIPTIQNHKKHNWERDNFPPPTPPPPPRLRICDSQTVQHFIFLRRLGKRTISVFDYISLYGVNSDGINHSGTLYLRAKKKVIKIALVVVEIRSPNLSIQRPVLYLLIRHERGVAISGVLTE